MRSPAILVCDDDADILTMLDFLLQNAGYTVLMARGYKEVLEKMKSDLKLILLDIRMPDLDGFHIAEALRMQGFKAPIIFMSAYEPSEKSVLSRSKHASGFFSKPFDPNKLLQKVATVIGGGCN